MGLGESFGLLIEEYLANKESDFAQNSLAEFVRQEIPETIRELLPDTERYFSKGSVGNGRWANVPWVAVFDRLITETAQDGVYLVYLVKEDCSGLCLSLNQGVTTVRTLYGASAKEALRARSADYAAKLGRVPDGLAVGPIDLAVVANAGLAACYESGAIVSKFYSLNDLADEACLVKDLQVFLKLYQKIYELDASIEGVNREDDEVDLGVEDCFNLRLHKRVERNKKLAEKAKSIHGYKCQACGFDFQNEYGEIGRDFIEAHHLTPIKDLRGTKTALNPKTDFSVLCSNCHRMIHRTEFVGYVEEFRAKYVVNLIRAR